MPDGYGTSIATLKRICRDSPEALDAIDRACLRKPGGTNNASGVNQHSDSEVIVDNIHNDRQERPSGTSRDAAIRRLRKDRPDLHEKVLREQITPHAAMIEAGFRKKLSNVEQMMSIWRKSSPQEKDEIFEWMESARA